MTPTLFDHVLALVVGVLLPGAGAVRAFRRDDSEPENAAEPEQYASTDKIAMYWSNALFLALLAAACMAVWWYGGRAWNELGLTTAQRNLPAGAGLALVMLAGFAIDTRGKLSPSRIEATRARWRRDTPFMPVTPTELRHSLVLVTSASVCEEMLYRGFLIAYVAAFTGTSTAGMALAVAIPAVIFGGSHLYQGPRSAAKIALFSLLFGAMYVVTGSLWLPMIIHFLIDLVGMFLSPRLLGRTGQAAGEVD